MQTQMIQVIKSRPNDANIIGDTPDGKTAYTMLLTDIANGWKIYSAIPVTNGMGYCAIDYILIKEDI